MAAARACACRRARRKRREAVARAERKQRRRGWMHRFRGFVRDYTEGLRGSDLRRLFDRDVARAFDVLTEGQERPDTKLRWGLRRIGHSVRLAFLGISYKLTPARRAVFGLSVLCAVFGILSIKFDVNRKATHLTVDSSPALFVLAFLGMVFLLAVELVDRVRVRDELEVARELQRDILPERAPDLPGYAFASSWRTANEIGGDYFNFVPLADGRLAVMIGDASGHGMAAGLMMASAHATLLSACESNPAPENAATLLHRVLRRSRDRRGFMTLFYGLLAPGDGRLDFVCAAHPFPLLRRRNGTIVELGEGGFPLGIGEHPRVRPGTVTLEPGDALLLFTDGIPEALSPATGEAFGFDHLRAFLAPGSSAQQILARILAAFDAHVGQEPLEDDFTVVVVERLAAPAS